jgi:ABC-type branched-subunit amino acid transport system substrate-binding protein
MNRRRFLVPTALAGVAALLLVACGGSSSPKGTSSPTTAGVKTLTAAPGFDPAAGTIHLGVVTPLTGAAAVIGKPLTAGTEMWFKYINSQGGIGGKYKVVLDEEDSQYTPQLGVQGYNKIKGGDTLIVQLLGTPITSAVLPLLRQDQVVAAPASLDATWVHDPNLIPVGAPYQIQMINAADYVVNTLGLKQKVVCTFIQADTYGQAGLDGVNYAGQSLGFTVKTTVKYNAGATDVTAQIQQLKSSGCQVVYLVSTPDITAVAFTKAAQLQFAPQWVGASPTYVGALATSPLGPYMKAHYIVASEGTEWGDTSVKGMADMLTRVQQFAPTQAPDGFFVFGYYQAWAVTDILAKAIQLGDLSRTGIMNAMAQVGTISLDGLAGDYDYGTGPSTRKPPRATTIFTVDPAKPGGLAKVTGKVNFSTPLAQQYTIPSS